MQNMQFKPYFVPSQLQLNRQAPGFKYMALVMNIMKYHGAKLLAGCVVLAYITFLIVIFVLTESIDEYQVSMVKFGTFATIMFLWSLLKCSRSDPGFLPVNTTAAELEKLNNSGGDDKSPDSAGGAAASDDVEAKGGQGPESAQKEGAGDDKSAAQSNKPKDPKVCDKCHVLRPERAHHCSKCARCVLVMDHHCMVSSTCIGLKNRRIFILMLFWGACALLTGTLIALTLVPEAYAELQKAWDDDAYLTLIRKGTFFIFVFACIANEFTLAKFFIESFARVLRNQTTLEEMLGQFDRERKFSKIYDTGSKYKNFVEVFGDNPLLWLVPIGGYKGKVQQQDVNLDQL